MNLHWLAVVGISLGCFNSLADAPKKADPNPVDQKVIDALQGSWINELESTLAINGINPDTGAISGSYRTKPDEGTSAALGRKPTTEYFANA